MIFLPCHFLENILVFLCGADLFAGTTTFDGLLHLGGGLEKFLQRNNGCGLVICIMCSYSYSTRGAENYEIFTLSPSQFFSLV